MPSSADALYSDLMDAAAAQQRLPCTDDARYIADQPAISDADAAEMAAGCDLCRIRTHCAAYAAVAHPAGGFWAGHRWRRLADRIDAAERAAASTTHVAVR